MTLIGNNKLRSKKETTGRQGSIGSAPLVLLVLFFLIPMVLNSNITRASGSTLNLIESQVETSTQRLYEGNAIFLPVIHKDLVGFVVSPNGSDTNPGSTSLPLRTIGKAASMVRPGDIVYIREGIYNEYFKIRASGTELQPISFMAYPGENPIIDAGYGNPGSNVGAIDVIGDHISISGLEVRNSALMGIYIYGNHNNVNNVYVHHNKENGILINHGYNSIVEYSRVWRNALNNEFGQANNWSGGLNAGRNGVSHAIIRHNIVWENWGEGISTFESDHTIIEDNIVHDSFSTNIYISDSTNVLCQRNFVFTDPSSYVFPYSSQGGIQLGDERYDPPSAYITIINNISYNNRVNFYWWDGVQGGGMNNVLIANNTFVNSSGTSGVKIINGTHQNVQFKNNIIQQDGSLPVILVDENPELHFSNNLWSKTPSPAAAGPGDIIGDPLISQVGDPYSPAWFMVTGVSPAINGAISLPNITYDFFLNSREYPPDMGAHEFYP